MTLTNGKIIDTTVNNSVTKIIRKEWECSSSVKTLREVESFSSFGKGGREECTNNRGSEYHQHTNRCISVVAYFLNEIRFLIDTSYEVNGATIWVNKYETP